MVLVEGYKEFKRIVDGLSSQVSYCEFARKLSSDIDYSGDKTFQKGVVVCKKKIGAIDITDYTCGLKRVKFNTKGDLEAECNWFGSEKSFDLRELVIKN